MKIDSTQTILPPSQTEAGKKAQPAQEEARAQAKSGATVTHLSAANDTSQDVDVARVAELRQAISDGSFDASPDRIAEGMLARGLSDNTQG